MRQAKLALLIVALAALPSAAQDAVKLDDSNSATISLSALGGWTLLPDGETLVISSPQAAELVYVNTSEDKEEKRVKVDFQPAALAARGSSIYAVGKGSSVLYVLDATTGKAKKEIRIPGAKVSKLVCHPTNGPLFAANESYEVLAINTESGKVTKTPAQGNFLAVDPAKGDFLYAGTQKPMKDVLTLSRGPGNSVRVGVARTNRNSTVVKYSVKPKEIKAEAVLYNAAINGREVDVSRDGKKIAVVGAGGMQGEDGKRSYAIGVFDAKDFNTQLGQVETGAYPTGIAFHPVLDIGAAERSGGVVFLFNARSLGIDKTLEAPGKGAAKTESGLLSFGGRGTKLVYFFAGSPAAPRGTSRSRATSRTSPGSDQGGTLYLVPLDLSDEQKAELAKAYPPAKR